MAFKVKNFSEELKEVKSDFLAILKDEEKGEKEIKDFMKENCEGSWLVAISNSSIPHMRVITDKGAVTLHKDARFVDLTGGAFKDLALFTSELYYKTNNNKAVREYVTEHASGLVTDLKTEDGFASMSEAIEEGEGVEGINAKNFAALKGEFKKYKKAVEKLDIHNYPNYFIVVESE